MLDIIKQRKSVVDLLDIELKTFAYNRPYSWNIDKIKDLLNDLKAVLEIKSHLYGGNFKYTMGPILLCKDGCKPVEGIYKDVYGIIDGQQRIISFVLLYKYLKPDFSCSLLDQNKGNKHFEENFSFVHKWFNEDENLKSSFLELLKNTVDVLLVISDKNSIIDNFEDYGKLCNDETIFDYSELENDLKPTSLKTIEEKIDKLDLKVSTGIQNTNKIDNEILETVKYTASQVDDISVKIGELSKRIDGYQSLVDRQLELASSAEEKERIIQAFSDECVQRIITETKTKDSQEVYEKELQKLKELFGENTWNKLEPDSKSFLITSRIVFNKLVELGDFVDYSEACLPVTKALEVEVNKRFYKNYIRYLKRKYPGKNNFSMYPSALLDASGDDVKIKYFTLGTTIYILGVEKSKYSSEEQFENDKVQILDYVKTELISDKSDEEIFLILKDFGESIEKVKRDFRNPAAHTNLIKRCTAEQCFDFVVDIEQLLKHFVEAFRN